MVRTTPPTPGLRLITAHVTVAVSRTLYDHAGRVAQTIENYVDGDPRTGSNDEDRITAYTYNPEGQIATLTALMKNATGDDDQATTYVYGIAPSGGSGFYSNSHLRAIIYPDSDDPDDLSGNGTDGIFDRVELAYNRQGELIQRTDQREVVHEYDYDALGRLIHDRVTSLGRGTENVDAAVRRITRTYEVRGMLASVSSHDNATPASGQTLNEITYAYNDFGQLISEAQEHAGQVDGSTPAVTLAYEDGSDLTKLIRPVKMTYPNGRELHYLYADSGDTAGISHVLGRVTAMANAATRGSSDTNVIAAFEHLGTSRVIRKSYPAPQVRLDHFGGTPGSYSGLDRFGRVIAQRWDRYDAQGDHDSDVIHITHGYDRASNRLYAQRHVYQSHSEVYQYDNLHRLISYQTGLITAPPAPPEAIVDYWQPGRGGGSGGGGGQSWTLDLLGNQLAVSDLGTADYFQNTPNHANEYTTRLVQAGQPKPPFASDDFTSDTTAANWQKPGSGDAFDIDTAAAEKLTVTAVSQDTIDTVQEPEAQAILLMGEAIGPVQGSVILRFPAAATTGQAGFVFGYRDGSDYWLRVLDLEEEEVRVYHVDNGVKTLKDAQPYTAAADVDILLTAPSKRQSLWQPGSHNFAGGTGYPAGQVGLYTTVADTTFDHYALYDDAQYRSLTDRWQSYSAAAHINATDGRLELSSSLPGGIGEGGLEANALSPVLLRSVRVEAFEATFAVRPVGAGSDHSLAFVFGASGQDDYSFVTLYHTDTQTAPTGYEVIAGKLASEVTGTSTDANMPTLTSSDVLWVRVRSDGTILTVRCATSEAGLTTASDVYSSSNFGQLGGMIGFAAHNSRVSVDNLTLNRWNPTTSQYDITEHVETFDVDSSGYREETLAHDSAGNLTYDGVYGYIYDAWNRLVSITPAWRDDQTDLQFGSVVQTNHYDGQGRRIIKAVTHSASLTATYHHYYDAGGHSLIEERLANGHVVRQHVWAGAAGGYIDELIQVSLNSDPTLNDTCEVHHYALHNANFNVMALINDAGDIVERYEYTPYGQRQVYVSAGSTDPFATAPVNQSQRWQIDGTPQPYSLNDVGHQGLLHDRVINLIYNRTRMMGPTIRRFMQRDLLEYVDGWSMKQYVESNPIVRVDPDGAKWWDWVPFVKTGVHWMVPPLGSRPLDYMGCMAFVNNTNCKECPGGPPAAEKQCIDCIKKLEIQYLVSATAGAIPIDMLEGVGAAVLMYAGQKSASQGLKSLLGPIGVALLIDAGIDALATFKNFKEIAGGAHSALGFCQCK